MIVIALDEIIMAFIYVFQVHINIPRDFKNFYKVLQGRRKYPELKLFKSKSDRLMFSGCSLARPSTTTQCKHTWPVPGLPEGIREEGWRDRGGARSGKWMGKGEG
jgi:hypothetical protein